ncbi:hypothetical protein DFQ28_011087 [Apophysomyces sp. BC1034]|nr:hypothetical protein DFQ29_008849 [Apophysomyces sp. BC1021]KAG0172485.1 hypothetical protein DFQ30_010362 [Apophysomyces sp. BC1015]KAG0184469.1 hypothetical protein DFQ28_011087 [Apophysomyces sp. BC1034]
MSDFGDFNSSSDPTADFLARERAALGEDADLFTADNISSVTSPVADVYSPASSALVPSQPQEVVPASDYSAFEADFPKAEELETSQAFHKAMLPDEEPEVVRQWREKQKELIAQRDEESEQRKQESVQRAREEIDRFYEEYNEKKQKSIEENREREENYQKDREEASSANVWERVVREFDVSNAKNTYQTRDVSRMKQLMLDLRKDANAPGTIVEA